MATRPTSSTFCVLLVCQRIQWIRKSRRLVMRARSSCARSRVDSIQFHWCVKILDRDSGEGRHVAQGSLGS